MPVTYEVIGTPVTLGSSSALVQFANLPQTYTDIIAVVVGQNTTGTTAMSNQCSLNGDVTTPGGNYSSTTLSAGSTFPTSSRGSGNNGMNIGTFWNTSRSVAIINYMNYSQSNTYKTVITKSFTLGGSGTAFETIVGLWRNTAAITQINFKQAIGESGLYDVGTTFTLYGVKAA
jgi:hypothetical protein